MTTLGVIRYSGTLTVPPQPEPGSYCPTCRRLGLLLTPPLHNVWGHYCSGCQQLFNGLATYAYDMAMHFSLGLSFPAIERRKQAVRRRPRRPRATPAAAGDEEAAA